MGTGWMTEVGDLPSTQEPGRAHQVPGDGDGASESRRLP